jgi:apolipoprotein D and lipocalin family protein
MLTPVPKLTERRTCFYPVPDPKFDLEAYLGTWYQVAGTPFGPTAGARCITANYALNVSLFIQMVGKQ